MLLQRLFLHTLRTPLTEEGHVTCPSCQEYKASLVTLLGYEYRIIKALVLQFSACICKEHMSVLIHISSYWHKTLKISTMLCD